MKDKHLKAYMKTAHAFAECSTARRLQVGAIVVKDNRIISIGYNGMPSGWDNNCEIVEESMEDNPWHDYSELTKSGWLFGMGGRYIKLYSPLLLVISFVIKLPNSSFKITVEFVIGIPEPSYTTVPVILL